MKRTVLCALLVAIGPLMAADAPMDQVQRGRDWFLSSPKGIACATCHSLEGRGNAVGPDLTRLASVVGPRGLLMTIEMSMTAYVQRFELKNGHGFSGIQKEKEGEMLTIFDLSKVPAVELKVKESDVSSIKPNTQWKHPPTSAGYSAQELADIIAYLKFASTGVVHQVTIGDMK